MTSSIDPVDQPNTLGADMSTSRPTLTGTTLSPDSPERSRFNNVLHLPRFPGSYGAALLLTGSLIPVFSFAAIITVVVYVAPLQIQTPFFQLGTNWTAILLGLVFTLVLWVFLSPLTISWTTFDHSNGFNSGEFIRQLISLNARFSVLKRLAQEYEESPSQEVHDALIAINENLERRGLQWVLGTGYLDVWKFLHNAEEAMLQLAPDEVVIGEALYDELCIKDSAIASQEDLLDKLGRAVSLLSPSAKKYLSGTTQIHLLSTNLASDTGSVTDGRNILRFVRHELNQFRESYWGALIRVRRQLISTSLITSFATYALLCATILMGASQSSIKAVTLFYLVGGLTGLFSRLYRESSTDKTMNDFGNTGARILLMPVISGLSAIAGVLFVVGVFNALPQLSLKLGDVYNPANWQNFVILAAIFGLLPNLFMSAIQAQTNFHLASLKSLEATMGGRVNAQMSSGSMQSSLPGLSQASDWSLVSTGLAVLCLLLVVLGVIKILTGSTLVGLVLAVAGAAPLIIAVIAFRYMQKSYKDVDEMSDKELQRGRIDQALSLDDTTLVRELTGQEPNASATKQAQVTPATTSHTADNKPDAPQRKQQDQKKDIQSAIAESVDNELSLLQKLQATHSSEASKWFLLCIIAATIGFLIILAGAIASIIGTPNGWTASLAGTIPSAASALFFQQKKSSDDLVDKDMTRISDLKDQERHFQLVLKTHDKELIDDFARSFFKLPMLGDKAHPETK